MDETRKSIDTIKKIGQETNSSLTPAVPGRDLSCSSSESVTTIGETYVSITNLTVDNNTYIDVNAL